MGSFDHREALDLLAQMPDEARIAFLETVPEDKRERLRRRVEQAPIEQAGWMLEDLDEVRDAENAPPEELSAEEIAEELKPIVEIYRFRDNRVERAQRAEKGCWVNIVNPPRDSLPLIAERFKIPLDFLTSSLDLDETARIEIEDHATLVTVRVPFFDEKNVDVLYFTLPIAKPSLTVPKLRPYVYGAVVHQLPSSEKRRT